MQALQQRHPDKIAEVRGYGLMLGIKLHEKFSNDTLKNKLLENKLLTNTAGDNVVRILPPLIIDESHIDEAVGIIDKTCAAL